MRVKEGSKGDAEILLVGRGRGKDAEDGVWIELEEFLE